MLLLHEFKKKKFILPDKKVPTSAKEWRKSMQDEMYEDD
jgi:hypothetical protein